MAVGMRLFPVVIKRMAKIQQAAVRQHIGGNLGFGQFRLGHRHAMGIRDGQFATARIGTADRMVCRSLGSPSVRQIKQPVFEQAATTPECLLSPESFVSCRLSSMRWEILVLNKATEPANTVPVAVFSIR